MPAKVHLNSEQFDGWHHAHCCAGDWRPEERRCMDAEEFERLPRARRCARCTRYWWPRGGDPINGDPEIAFSSRHFSLAG